MFQSNDQRGRVMAAKVFVAAMVTVSFSPTSFAQSACGPPVASFRGFWGSGLLQIGESVAGVPVVVTTRVSYQDIRHSPCNGGARVLPPGITNASVSVGFPIWDRRRGGWLLQMAAKGQASQKPGAPVSGMMTGAPATAGHLNIWETPIPLIQLTGAASAAITPQARDFPVSIAYLGGVRLYPLYAKHAQINLGVTVGGNDGAINFVPGMASRVSDFLILNHKIALGLEVRSPISLLPGPTPVSWRFWGGISVTIAEQGERKDARPSPGPTSKLAFDIAHSSPEAAPPAQTTWETVL